MSTTEPNNTTDRWLNSLKNRRTVAAIVVTFIVIAGIGTLADTYKKVRDVIPPESKLSDAKLHTVPQSPPTGILEPPPPATRAASSTQMQTPVRIDPPPPKPVPERDRVFPIVNTPPALEKPIQPVSRVQTTRKGSPPAVFEDGTVAAVTGRGGDMRYELSVNGEKRSRVSIGEEFPAKSNKITSCVVTFNGPKEDVRVNRTELVEFAYQCR